MIELAAVRSEALAWHARTALVAALMLLPIWAHAGPLDRLSPAELHKAMLAELDDKSLAHCGLVNPRGPIKTADMFEIVMCALGDDGDDEEDEQIISLHDLELEMDEADHDTVEHVVRLALGMAERMASDRMAPAGGFMRVMFSPDRPASDIGDGEFGPLARPDGVINPAIVMRGVVAQSLETKVRSAKQ